MHFFLNFEAIIAGQSVIRRLKRQLPHPLENAVGFMQCSFGSLKHRDSILRIQNRTGQATNLSPQLFTDRQASRIICRSVDPQPGTQFLHRVFQTRRGMGQGSVCLKGKDVLIYSQRHFWFLTQDPRLHLGHNGQGGTRSSLSTGEREVTNAIEAVAALLAGPGWPGPAWPYLTGKRFDFW